MYCVDLQELEDLDSVLGTSFFYFNNKMVVT